MGEIKNADGSVTRFDEPNKNSDETVQKGNPPVASGQGVDVNKETNQLLTRNGRPVGPLNSDAGTRANAEAGPLDGATQGSNAGKVEPDARVSSPDKVAVSNEHGSDVTGSPVEGKDNTGNVDKLVRESQEAMVSEVGKVPDSNKALRDRIKEKLEDKSPESAKADISQELANPGAERLRGDIAGNRTIQREDGTITTERHPDHTAHYIHGTRVLITDEQKAKVDEMTNRLTELEDGRAIGDIPVFDPYWDHKKELDAYVARLKR